MREIGTIKSAMAFTLVEMVVVVFIMSIIGVISLALVADTADLYTLLLAQRRADSEVFDALNRIGREVRVYRSSAAASSLAWSFVNAKTAAVNVSASGDSVFLNGYPLARGISLFQFQYFDADNALLNVPLISSDLEKISRVQIALKATNSHASSEAIFNLHLMRGYLK
jgi:type II secretory pathway pseudopilin PulG